MLQKKIVNFLFSTRLMAVLFIVFALALAVGTFIENSYTTATARAWIYNAHWFEAIMLLFVVNFMGNIARYKLYTWRKFPTLLLHLSFILIIIGAGVTRYISYEGVMPIREGKISNTILSDKTFLTAYIDGEVNGEPKRRVVTKELLLAPGINNHKTRKTDFKGQDIKFEVLKFIPNAKKGLVATEDGKNHIKIVESGEGSRHDHYLEEGQVTSIHNVLFAYNKMTEGAINILVDSTGEYSIKTPFEGDYMRMADMKKGTVAKDSVQPLVLRSLYSMAGMQFVFPDPAVKGEFDLVPLPDEEVTDGLPDGVVMKVTTNGESEIIKILGGRGIVNDFEKFNLGGLEFHVRYGSKEYKLPFSIKLNDFIASKYPGTEDNPTPSYSAFKSKVELIDEGQTTPHEIYMNHVLDHKGYRFFQASFDRDEKGTILSVSHDWWGTWITYVGYTLLYIGMLLILFVPGSRFKELEKALKKIKTRKKKMLSVLLVLFSVSAFSQANDSLVQSEEHAHSETAHVHSEENHVHAQDSTSASTIKEQAEVQVLPKTMVDSIITTLAVKPEHAAKFGRLVIQDMGGRMKPAHTYSSELLRKISENNEYEGLNGDQVLLSMLQMPTLWYNVPFIKVERKNDSLHQILKIEKGKQMIPLAEFFDARGNYKLSPYLEAAYRAKVPNQFQKDFKKADQKVNLMYSALQGKLLRIFPLPNSENNKWVSYADLKEGDFKGMDSLYTSQVLPLYFGALRQAQASGDYEQANELLESMKGFQKKYGSEVMPSEEKIETEILYNEYNVFNKLFTLYLLAGVFMLIFVIAQIFKPNKLVNTMVLLGKIAIVLFFALHTAGLIARWYISGYAPWSNAYESIIYVAWATMLFGIIFGRKSNLTMAATTFVTAIILMVAHWNWLDPSIGNLAPVLDSYWLMIHVAVIVASYGPFTLGMILGVMALLMILATNEKNLKKMRLNLKEITIVNEMALTIGLVMLTIGNFLGGQWANESWGRYWGWDPKETWALVSIMVYAFVIHMRFVPGMKGRFAFNWASIIAFGAILMTYFGVNFYLTGLHSYASGDQIISYKFIIGSLLAWLILGFFARKKYIKYYRKSLRKELRQEEENQK